MSLVAIVRTAVVVDEVAVRGMKGVASRAAEPAAIDATARRLRSAGLESTAVEIGEFQKAEAGLTCLSLLVPAVPV